MSNFVKIPFTGAPFNFKSAHSVEYATLMRIASDFVRGGVSPSRSKIIVRDVDVAPRPPHPAHPDYQPYTLTIAKKNAEESLFAEDAEIIEDILLRWGYRTDAPGCRGERAFVLIGDPDFAVGDAMYMCHVQLGTAVFFSEKRVSVGYPATQEEFVAEMTSLQKMLWEEGFMLRQIEGYFGTVTCGVASGSDGVADTDTSLPSEESSEELVRVSDETLAQEFEEWRDSVVKKILTMAVVALESPASEFELALDDIQSYISAIRKS